MRQSIRCVFLLLFSILPAACQTLINRSILSGNGSDQPAVIATGGNGFVYVAGNTTSGNFPVTNAQEAQPPQGALEVSVNGAAFVNSSLTATNVYAVAASADGHLVIASTSNGIVRSTNQGVTWTAASTLLPLCSALAVDPVNPSNAYALLLQSGALYKSSNGGANWQSTGASFEGADAVTQIVINPQTPATMYIWAGYAVYRSTDGAQSWQPLSIRNNQVSAFAMAPSQPNVVYATGVQSGFVFRSDDGGTSWTQANSSAIGSMAGMAVDSTEPTTVWLVNDGGNIYRSTDGGASFQVVTTLSGDATVFSVAVDPANPERVYVAGSGTFETPDGGRTWSNVGTSYAQSLYAAPARIYSVGSTSQTVFLAKFDATLSQVVYSTYLWTGAVSGIALDGAGDVYLAGSDSTGSNGIAMKVSAADSSVLYSTTLYGAIPNAIAIDASGNAFIAGTAATLPVAKGAYQATSPALAPTRSICSTPSRPS
jgi:photosystem II stability/assembly factor-like uncharacterized protein